VSQKNERSNIALGYLISLLELDKIGFDKNFYPTFDLFVQHRPSGVRHFIHLFPGVRPSNLANARNEGLPLGYRPTCPFGGGCKREINSNNMETYFFSAC